MATHQALEGFRKTSCELVDETPHDSEARSPQYIRGGTEEEDSKVVVCCGRSTEQVFHQRRLSAPNLAPEPEKTAILSAPPSLESRIRGEPLATIVLREVDFVLSAAHLRKGQRVEKGGGICVRDPGDVIFELAHEVTALSDWRIVDDGRGGPPRKRGRPSRYSLGIGICS